MAKHMGNDEFLTSLTTLLTTTHSASKGSIFLVQKSMPQSASAAHNDPPRTLIRATNGKPTNTKKFPGKAPKIKLSTVVEEPELATFYTKYAEVCKRGMEGLRKRDKKKAKAKRKKKTTEGGAKKFG